MKRLIYSSNDMKTFIYEGPMYRFDRYVGDMSCKRKATSIGKAKVAFLNEVRRQLGLGYRSNVSIDDWRIDELVDKPITEDVKRKEYKELELKEQEPIQRQLPGFEDV